MRIEVNVQTGEVQYIEEDVVAAEPVVEPVVEPVPEPVVEEVVEPTPAPEGEA